MTILLATSLKMYFDHAQTLAWAKDVAQIATDSPIVRKGTVELAVFPGFPSLHGTRDVLAGSKVTLGAQNMATTERGPLTGEVGAPSLVQVGCTYVEIAHAERRHLFHETLGDIQQKVSTAYDNGLIPLVCTGEESRMNAQEAAAECIAFLAEALAHTPSAERTDIVVAYEPVWAIGASRPADSSHVREVTSILRSWVKRNFHRGRIIYGGSAGPGVYKALQGSVDGLFLGRFAHNPMAISALLEEVRDHHARQG